MKFSDYSLTAHIIDENYERKFYVLSTEPFDQAHTGPNIAECLQNLLTEFGIENVHLILRDAATSMISAMDFLGCEHFDCMVHKIQLVRILIKINNVCVM